VEDDARVPAGEPVDHRQHRPGGDRLGAPDPQLARRRIGEEFDVLHALAQLVENRDAAPDDGLAVLRRRDAPGAAFEQAHAERMLEIGNRARDCRLRGAESLRRLGHAARLDHRHEHAHVVQLQATFDAVDRAHGAPLYQSRYSLIEQ
jgi:hypothetical protein